MGQKTLVICGDAKPADVGLREVDYDSTIPLDTEGPSQNVRLEFPDESLVATLAEEALDLLEIASYVYAADRLVSRGDADVRGDRWVRQNTIVLSVRRPNVWLQGPLRKRLQALLGWLTEDEWQLHFVSRRRPTAQRVPLLEDNTFSSRTCVALFSGGLDSLSGALWDVDTKGHRPILVSHRSTDVFNSRQKSLAQAVMAGTDAYVHVSCWVHLTDRDREHTQRSRSFLYLALAAVVAAQFGIREIHVFENGTLSINLPISRQVVGTHASRSTHPRFIREMEQLCAQLLSNPAHIDLPFFEKTKTETVDEIVRMGRQDLIQSSVSCTHVEGQSRLRPHCGICSQCIDRRFAVEASGVVKMDPTYERDIFVDSVAGFPRRAEARGLIEGYIRTYRRAGLLTTESLMYEYPELFDLVGSVPTPTLERLDQLFARQADVINRVLAAKISEYAVELREGSLPKDCALRLVLGGALALEAHQRYADKIADIAAACLPVAFKREAASNEPEVRGALETGLAGHDMELDSELPQFAHVVGVGAVPDASSNKESVFVELKYPRRTRPLRQIAEEMDADITHYRGRAETTLFIVFDPEGQIPDVRRFEREYEAKGEHILCRVVR